MSKHCGYITRIKNLRKHSNADRLMVGECFGNNVIVGLDTKEDELGFYIPTEIKLGLEFCEVNDLLRRKDENGNNAGGYLDPNKRNIVALKLRKEKSDGLFMPLSSLNEFCDIFKLKEGDTIDILNGVVICEKYIPKTNFVSVGRAEKDKRKAHEKELFPNFKEHVDTEQLMYNQNEFKEGDICTISLKLDGTSHRIANTQKTITKKVLFRKPKTIKEWITVSGSRHVILDFENSKDIKNGYYGTNEFRKKWHDIISPKLYKGETVYGEIIGYLENGTPIMPSVQNKKADKEIVKQYGETTTFHYGCNVGENDFYIYRMTMTNEDGEEVEYPTWYAKLRAEMMGIKFVPIFEQFIFTTWEDLLERVENYYDGVDPIGKTHIREGVVVRIENRPIFKAFKHKNFVYKLLRGIAIKQIEDNSNNVDEDLLEEM